MKNRLKDWSLKDLRRNLAAMKEIDHKSRIIELLEELIRREKAKYKKLYNSQYE